jgi:hypothetical protein
VRSPSRASLALLERQRPQINAVGNQHVEGDTVSSVSVILVRNPMDHDSTGGTLGRTNAKRVGRPPGVVREKTLSRQSE